ncbi:MAG TPA: hypothetical protein VKW78_19740 [Terriglobales bacterium]|nr:hypothetical protein [Terriglobales bacterium]
MEDFGFTRAELRRLRAFRTPLLIQHFLESLPYHHADTAWSPRRVMEEGTAHCLEGAIFAAAALRVNGYKPLLLDFEAVQDSDHVIAIYRMNEGWGAIAKSNFALIRFRDPVYRSLRELAMSYFDGYHNLRGERTLRAFSRPVNLRRFDRLNWMTTAEPVWFIPEYLCEIPHTPLLTPAQEHSLTRLDPRVFRAGLIGYQPH